jgi:hypothetical protein
MSTPLAPTPRASAPVHPTRQQLDELDALLQRMLDLPVNQVDEEADGAPAGETPARPVPQPPVSYRVPEPPPAPPSLTAERAVGFKPQVRAPEPPARPPASYPASYMVVETATPRLVPPAPPEPEPEADDAEAMDLQPRVVPAVEFPEQPGPSADLPSTPSDHQEVEELTPSGHHPGGERVEPEAEWVPLRSSWHPSPQTWQPLAETWHQHRQAREPSAAPPPPDVAAAPAVEESPAAQPPAPGEITESVVRGPWSVVRAQEENTSCLDSGPRTEVETSSGEGIGLKDLAPAAASEESPEPGEEEVVDETPPTAPDLAGADAPVAWWLLPLVWFNAAFDACVTPFGPPGRFLCGRSGRSFLGSLGLLCLAAALALFAAVRIGWTW